MPLWIRVSERIKKHLNLPTSEGINHAIQVKTSLKGALLFGLAQSPFYVPHTPDLYAFFVL